MKKWLLILAVGITTVSCQQWWHENFCDVEECEEWYLKEMSETNDLDEFEEIYNDYTLWRSHLGEIAMWKANAKNMEWSDDNEEKSEKINKNINKLRKLYRD